MDNLTCLLQSNLFQETIFGTQITTIVSYDLDKLVQRLKSLYLQRSVSGSNPVKSHWTQVCFKSGVSDLQLVVT